MGLNPMALLHMKERLTLFQQDHPKARAFFHTLRQDALEPGTILELKATLKDGTQRVMNIRLTENDVETLKMIHKNSKK